MNLKYYNIDCFAMLAGENELAILIKNLSL